MSNSLLKEECTSETKLSRAISILKKVRKYPIGNNDSDLEKEINDFLQQFEKGNK